MEVVQKHVAAVAEHVDGDQEALSQGVAFELGDEVAAGDEARHVYSMAEKVVLDGGHLSGDAGFFRRFFRKLPQEGGGADAGGDGVRGGADGGVLQAETGLKFGDKASQEADAVFDLYVVLVVVLGGQGFPPGI